MYSNITEAMAHMNRLPQFFDFQYRDAAIWICIAGFILTMLLADTRRGNWNWKGAAVGTSTTAVGLAFLLAYIWVARHVIFIF